MKRLVLIASALTATVALAACNKADTAAQAPVAAPEATPVASAPTASGSMAGMNMTSSDAAKMAKATGTVTAVDGQAGTITVSHGPIPEANWPAMTMGFKAAPNLVQAVKPGDKVAFELKLASGSGEITAIQKQ